MDERIEIEGATEWFIEFGHKIIDLMHESIEDSKKFPNDSDDSKLIDQAIILLLKAEGEIARLNTEKINHYLSKEDNALMKESDFLYRN